MYEVFCGWCLSVCLSQNVPLQQTLPRLLQQRWEDAGSATLSAYVVTQHRLFITTVTHNVVTTILSVFDVNKETVAGVDNESLPQVDLPPANIRVSTPAADMFNESVKNTITISCTQDDSDVILFHIYAS